MKALLPLDNGQSILPDDVAAATLVFRIMMPAGPAICTLRDGKAVDITADIPAVAHLLRHDLPAKAARKAKGVALGSIDTIVKNSDEAHRDLQMPYLLAPIDLQAVKACGVTFVSSMVERVVEEMIGGDPGKAQESRAELSEQVGGRLDAIVPGSPEAGALKVLLQEKDLWSQYLEVGIGPDAEIFTKAQPMSSVGHGAVLFFSPDDTRVPCGGCEASTDCGRPPESKSRSG